MGEGPKSLAAPCFPFTCLASPQIRGPSTRFQQVYDASRFPRPLDIGTISFFTNFPGSLSTLTFDLYLSTTARGVDALDRTNLDANPGPSPALFGTFTIGGPVTQVLALTGTPYHYDPAAGNLLLDIRFLAGNPFGATTTMRGSTRGARAYGSAHDYFADGEPYRSDYGLDTGFNVTAFVPEPATVALTAGGLLVLAGVARRRRA